MRFIFFILLYIAALFIPWPIAALAAAAYACHWEGFELLFGALLIDTYFGTSFSLPYYTLAAGVILILSFWLKPKLLAYNK